MTMNEQMVLDDLDSCGQPGTFVMSSGLYSFLWQQPHRDDPETDVFFFHSDHLGSTSYITAFDGTPYQHVEYLPLGEALLEEKSQTWQSPYKFNCKELDDESGLYYYGARYYDPKSAVFLGVDPMSDKYPGWSPFAYCMNNPVCLQDPDGCEVDDYFDNITGEYLYTDNSQTDNIRTIDRTVFNMTMTAAEKSGLSEDSKTQLLQNNSNLANGNFNGLSDEAAANILNHYYKEAGYDLNELNGNSITPDANTLYQEFYDRALARTDITTNGKLSIGIEKSEIGSIIKTKSDMISLFIHERGGHGSDFFKAFKGEMPGFRSSSSTSWESRATLKQVQHPSWNTVSPEFRSHMISTYGKYMPSYYNH